MYELFLLCVVLWFLQAHQRNQATEGEPAYHGTNLDLADLDDGDIPCESLGWFRWSAYLCLTCIGSFICTERGTRTFQITNFISVLSFGIKFRTPKNIPAKTIVKCNKITKQARGVVCLMIHIEQKFTGRHAFSDSCDSFQRAKATSPVILIATLILNNSLIVPGLGDFCFEKN